MDVLEVRRRVLASISDTRVRVRLVEVSLRNSHGGFSSALEGSSKAVESKSHGIFDTQKGKNIDFDLTDQFDCA